MAHSVDHRSRFGLVRGVRLFASLVLIATGCALTGCSFPGITREFVVHAQDYRISETVHEWEYVIEHKPRFPGWVEFEMNCAASEAVFTSSRRIELSGIDSKGMSLFDLDASKEGEDFSQYLLRGWNSSDPDPDRTCTVLPRFAPVPSRMDTGKFPALITLRIHFESPPSEIHPILVVKRNMHLPFWMD